MGVQDAYLMLAHIEGWGSSPLPGVLRAWSDPAVVLDPELSRAFRATLPAAAVRRWNEAELDEVARALRQGATRAGLSVLDPTHELWPPRLYDAPTPPLCLFVRGDARVLCAERLHIAVVGSRTPTEYGKLAARDYTTQLARAGVYVWSGLAAGIDAIAHRAALDAGTPTVAVLAGGLDEVYPRTNARLAEEIVAAGGALVSEIPVGRRATRGHFPRRNRILAGATSATLVVEAGMGSGSLHTARFAVDAGADVFAVPGAYTSSRSRGCHWLIEQGAGIASAPDRLLRQLEIEHALDGGDLAASASLGQHADGALICERLETGPRPIDLVMQESRLDRTAFLEALQQLTEAGWVRCLPGDLIGLAQPSGCSELSREEA